MRRRINISKIYCACGCSNQKYEYDNHNRRSKFIRGHNLRINNPAKREDVKKKISRTQMGKRCGPKNPFFGRTHTDRVRKIVSESMKKLLSNPENHPMWLGGISFERYPREFSNKLKDEIRNYYNNYCQLCYKPQRYGEEKLHVHHIDYNKHNNSFNNLVPLHRSCHTKTNHNREYFQNKFEVDMLSKEMLLPLGDIGYATI